MTPLEDSAVGEHSLYAARETWKEGSTGPVSTTRIDTWRDELDDDEIHILEVTTAELMARFGYERTTAGDDLPSPDEDSEVRVAAYRVYQSQIAGLGGLPLY